MIQASIDLRELDDLVRKFPDVAKRAHNAVAAMYRNMLASAVVDQGGKHGMPKFAPASTITRALKRRTPVGGVLVDSRSIVRFRRGFEQVIGWPDGLAPYAEAFQTAEERPFDRHERTTLPKRLIRQGVQPKRAYELVQEPYRRPARPVIEPFGAYVAARYANDLRARMEKELAKR